tara:strand:- start:1400 stop:2047 length:648 start_codon:yes stop_codon:yes gene_type:complete
MKKIKLMMVEDDESMLILIEEYLKKMDCFEFFLARNGLEAFKQMKKEFYPIILTDLMMPEMDGFELIEKTKKSDDIVKKENIEQIFVVISALEKSKDIQRAINLGAYDVLPKPLDRDLFLAKMKNYCLLHELMTDSENRYQKIKEMNKEIIENYENRLLENQSLNEAIEKQKEIYRKQVEILNKIQSLAKTVTTPDGEEILKQCDLLLNLDNLGK